jgi:hypothetical protein
VIEHALDGAVFFLVAFLIWTAISLLSVAAAWAWATADAALDRLWAAVARWRS